MLCGVLDKFSKQHSKKQQLYGHLPPISQISQVRQTRHCGICGVSKDKLISNILQ